MMIGLFGTPIRIRGIVAQGTAAGDYVILSSTKYRMPYSRWGRLTFRIAGFSFEKWTTEDASHRDFEGLFAPQGQLRILSLFWSGYSFSGIGKIG